MDFALFAMLCKMDSNYIFVVKTPFLFHVQISGRQMFEFNPDLVFDDDAEAGDGVLMREENEEEVSYLPLPLGVHDITAGKCESSHKESMSSL